MVVRDAGQLMRVVEYSPPREEYGWTFGGLAPVRRIQPSTALRLWTDDAFAGRVRSTTDRVEVALPDLLCNPQTGPFYVEGARPGDTLAIHILGLEPARDYGASCAFPGFGGLTSTSQSPALQPPLEERVWIYDVDRTARTVRYQALDSAFNVDLPLALMLGTVGVAPAGNEVRSSMVPDYFGGNMDCPMVAAGATIYLGVNVDGALFSVGDGHYRQGEGELCGSAVEGAMWVDLIVDVIHGVPTPSPRIETDQDFIALGSGRPLDDAWRIAQYNLVHWLAEATELGVMDAYQLVSQTARAPIANVVDPNFTATSVVAKSFLPPMSGYGGVHSRLVDAGRTWDRSPAQPATV